MNKTIVITGASSGIGAAAAAQLARRGATVCLVARRADLLDEVVAGITAEGGKAMAYPADLTDPESTAALIEQILADHPTIDVLVNNAARSIRRSITKSRSTRIQSPAARAALIRLCAAGFAAYCSYAICRTPFPPGRTAPV